MDLDINQVFVYILNNSLFAVVDSITFLYRVAARTRNEKVNAVLIAVAKEYMNLMALFEHPQDWDFRPIQFYLISLSIDSFSQIASDSLVLRLACSYAATSSSASADIISELVDMIVNDKKTKNDLIYLTQDMRRISNEFQCVSEMIFRDQPTNAATDIVRRCIMQSVRPWLAYIPISHDPRNASDLTFINGVLSVDMLHEIASAVSDLQDAFMLTTDFVLSSKDINKVEVDLASNVLTDMIIVQSMLEYHFPRDIIQPSNSSSECSNVQESNIKDYGSQDVVPFMLLCDALDIVTMCGVVIQSVQLNIGYNADDGIKKVIDFAAEKLHDTAFRMGMVCNSLLYRS